MRCFVTGCAGFIGSHLTARLLSANHDVIGYDNLSTGRMDFIDNQLRMPNFHFIKGDLLDTDTLNNSSQGCDIVFHLAANADVRFGIDHPHKDLQQNTIATFNVLEAMRLNSIKKIVFSSTGSVYGEAVIIPTPENAPFPVQTSLYGASKLACEGLIQAYAEGFDMQAFIFRFVSILGEHYTHGHVVDFYNQLISHPESLHVLGNGLQKKSYLHVSDCIEGILLALGKAVQKVNIFNLGTDSYCSVNDSIQWILECMNVTPIISYSGGERGWIGDNPFIYLDASKIRALGWNPKHTIEQSVKNTVQYLQKQSTALEMIL